MIAHFAARRLANIAVLLVALALATATQQVSADATSSCAADGSGCGAGGEEDASLLSTKINRHEVPSLAQGGPPVEGRCCYGLDSCPSQMGANDHVMGCKAASDHCSQSQAACEKKLCCKHGFFGKKHPKFCPVTAPPTQRCALGDNIRVVTDMGFDDWGAFSILQAAGCTPQRALGVEGMMTPDFTGDFSKLLQSWGLSTQVYKGPVQPPCYGGLGCPFNTSSVSWLSSDPDSYREKIYANLPGAINPEWDGDARVVNSIDDFWACEAGKKYTLLVISPQTAVAEQLLGPDASKYTSCISEIVYMGGMFDSEQLAQTDPRTAANVDGPRWNVSYYKVTSLLTETNVVSDALAAQAMWNDTLGIKQSIFSLETAGCERAGLQRILFAGQTAMYDDNTQKEQQAWADVMLKGAANCDSKTGPTSMLAKMVCIHDGCDIATLDFDAHVATYVWLGNEDKVNIQLERSSVFVDTHTAVTTRESDSSNTWVATTFNAIGWYGMLSDLLTAR